MVETKAAPPAIWETHVESPAGGVWKVRTVDLDRQALQMPAEMIKVIVANRGSFITTVYGPDGGQYKATYAPSRADAEAFHNRMADRIRAGGL